MPTRAELNRRQFNEQAAIFARWSGTVDVAYMASLADFIGLAAADRLLDVACGSGGFALFVARRLAWAIGLDIADVQVHMADRRARELGIRNVGFVCGNVERLPVQAERFSVVVSKSAFHHLRDPDAAFAEMYRVCEPGGVICIDDITAYDDPAATQLIDRLDTLIDVSHHRRLSAGEITALFTARGMHGIRSRRHVSERALREYQAHAQQTPANAAKLEEVVRETVESGAIRDVLYRRDGETYFVNPGMTVVGRKPT
jgi:ubiquinone/menaquinone biosynthesis C-methylase UbiE